MAFSDEVITLRGGFRVSLGALRLAWELEHRGFVLDDRLRVTPPQRLTPADVAAIRVHRDELRALAAYVEAIQ